MKKKRRKAYIRLKDLTPAELRRLKRSDRAWQKLMKPMKDAIEASGRITADDLKIIVR
jgi:hypothetical protein